MTAATIGSAAITFLSNTKILIVFQKNVKKIPKLQ